MKLYATSDLHIASGDNGKALAFMNPHPEDFLAIAGDIGESESQLRIALDSIRPKFKEMAWVPGNHDLWTMPIAKNAGLRGEEKYLKLVEICRGYDVYTPEDPYPHIELDGTTCVVAPTFTLYDYSYRPQQVPYHQAVEWSAATGVVAADEDFLFPDPFPSRKEWCEARVAYTEKRLAEIPPQLPIILINHYPIKEELARLPRVPTFKLWSGSKLTESWPGQFNIRVAIYGHLHIRSTKFIDNTCYEEVSLGYTRDWNAEKGINHYIRRIRLDKKG